MLKLIVGITALSRISELYDPEIETSIENVICQDLLLLRKDTKFMSTMLTIKAFIDENYSAFEAIK